MDLNPQLPGIQVKEGYERGRGEAKKSKKDGNKMKKSQKYVDLNNESDDLWDYWKTRLIRETDYLNVVIKISGRVNVNESILWTNLTGKKKLLGPQLQIFSRKIQKTNEWKKRKGVSGGGGETYFTVTKF